MERALDSHADPGQGNHAKRRHERKIAKHLRMDTDKFIKVRLPTGRAVCGCLSIMFCIYAHLLKHPSVYPCEGSDRKKAKVCLDCPGRSRMRADMEQNPSSVRFLAWTPPDRSL